MLKPIKYSLLLFTLLLSISCRQSSNEVLEAFNIMNEKLDESNNHHQAKIDSLNNVVVSTINSFKAEKLNTISDSLYSYIDTLKIRLTSKLKAPKDYNGIANQTIGDKLFFNSNGYTKVGQEFVDKLKHYKEEMNSMFGNEFPNKIKKVNEIFNTNDIEDSQWLNYHFKGFPMIATITKLTQIQSDVTQVKRDLLTEMIKE